MESRVKTVAEKKVETDLSIVSTFVAKKLKVKKSKIQITENADKKSCEDLFFSFT
jgi:hypothetical protein